MRKKIENTFVFVVLVLLPVCDSKYNGSSKFMKIGNVSLEKG